MRGTVKRFNPENNWGFIKSDEGGGEIFFHANEAIDRAYIPREGDVVEFEIRKDREGRPRATKLQHALIPPADPNLTLPVLDDTFTNLLQDVELLKEKFPDYTKVRSELARVLGAVSKPNPSRSALDVANFFALLSSSLLSADQFERADQRAETAFRQYAGFRSYSRFKKSLCSCLLVRIRCLLSLSSAEHRQDVSHLVTFIHSMLQEAFRGIGPVPRELTLEANRNVVIEADQERNNLRFDEQSLQQLLARSYPVLWQLPTGPNPECRLIKDEWRRAAEIHCRAIADEVAFSSAEEVGRQLSDRLEDFKAAKLHPTCHLTPDLFTLVQKVSEQARADSLASVDKILTPRKPAKELYTKKRRLLELFRNAVSQISHANYTGAAQSLDAAFRQEPTSAVLWEWSAYLNLCLNEPELAQRALEAAAMNSKSDEVAAWNLACARYRLNDLQQCLVALKQCAFTEARRAALAVCLRLESSELVGILESFDNLNLLALGYVAALTSKSHAAARRFLDRIVITLYSLRDPFPPLELDEELDEDDVQRTLTYYLKYNQLTDGIAHFQARRDRKQRPMFALLRAEAQLLEGDRQYEAAWRCLSDECEITINSAAAPVRKRESLTSLLDLCVRRDMHAKGISALDQHASLLDSTVVDDYRRQFQLPAREEHVGETDAEATAGTVRGPSSQVVKRQEPRLISEIDIGHAKANQRLAELNRQHGTISTIFQVKERYADLREYCDHMLTVYGPRAAQAADSMRSALDQLSAAASAKTEDDSRQAVAKARELLLELDGNLTAALTEDERRELVLARKLKVCLSTAEVRSGLIKDPTVQLLTTQFPTNRPETTLLIRIKNEGQEPVENITLSLSSLKGAIVLENKRISVSGALPTGGSRVVGFVVGKQGTEPNDVLKVSVDYAASGLPHTAQERSFNVNSAPFGLVPPERYIVGQSVPVSRPQNFHGRTGEIDNLLQLVEAASQGVQGIIYVDGIKQVGKSSLLNFITSRFPKSLLAVRLSMRGRDLASTAGVLRGVAEDAVRQGLVDRADDGDFVGSMEEYERSPIRAFRDCLSRIRRERPGCNLALIIDEVQALVQAVADAERGHTDLDTRIFSAWQGELEENRLIFILTGSLRASKVGRYLGSDAFFRRVARVPVGFLPYEATREALQIPVQSDGIIFTDEAIERVWALTRGYASVVQRCGRACLETLNRDGRRVVAPEDVDAIGEHLLREGQLFSWWWDTELLGPKDESVMRKFIELQGESTTRGVDFRRLKAELKELGSEVNVVISNLTDQEVLEFNDGKYCIKGDLLGTWLVRKFAGEESFTTDVLKYCALAIDHENFYLGLENVLKRRMSRHRIDEATLKTIISKVHDHVNSYGNLVLPVAVAVWGKGNFLRHQLLYKSVDQRFEPLFPAIFRPQASDDELRRAVIEKVEAVLLPVKSQGTIILIAGDHGYRELVDRLKKQGRRVAVWFWNYEGFSGDLKQAATKFEYLDDIVGIEEICATIT